MTPDIQDNIPSDSFFEEDDSQKVDSQEADSKNTIKFKLFSSTMELFQKQPEKRLQVLSCIYLSTGANSGVRIRLDYITKNTHLANLSEHEIVTATEILNEEGLIVLDTLQLTDFVEITSKGIMEIESKIDGMLEDVRESL